MRSEIGKISLDTLFRERELLNVGIVGKLFIEILVSKSKLCLSEAINKASKAWGIDCLRLVD